jgi:hypothetical protein
VHRSSGVDWTWSSSEKRKSLRASWTVFNATNTSGAAVESEEVWMELHVLHEHGWSISALARHFNLNRRTVRKELDADRPRGYPQRAPRHPFTEAQLTHIQRRLLVCPVLHTTGCAMSRAPNTGTRAAIGPSSTQPDLATHSVSTYICRLTGASRRPLGPPRGHRPPEPRTSLIRPLGSR